MTTRITKKWLDEYGFLNMDLDDEDVILDICEFRQQEQLFEQYLWERGIDCVIDQ